MPAIPYGVGAYRRDKGSLPPLTLVNMFLEKTPSAENGVVLMSRQGIITTAVRGSGPIRGMLTQPGTFNGDLFTVSGGFLYRAATLIGAIAGSGPVSFAASASEVLVTAGTQLYSYNGTNLLAVTMPDGFDTRAVAFISGHFIAIRNDTHKFYWSAQLDGRTFDALDFASAESEPDNLLDCVTMRGNLYLMGVSTIEPWYYTGALDLPFSLIQQRLFPKGTHSTGCAIEMDNALVWVGSDAIVYRTADVPERLSDHGIEERIESSATVSAFGFIYDGHSYFCIRLDASTFAYDFATGQWNELQSYGRTNFAGRNAAMLGQQVLFGDDATGKVLTFGTGYSDEGVTLLREFTAAFPIKGGTVMVDALTIDANAGRTELLVGQGSDPIIEIAASRDAGATWGPFRSAKLGQQGEYRNMVKITRCGMFDSPWHVQDPRDRSRCAASVECARE